MTTYTTTEGDMLDAIVAKVYSGNTAMLTDVLDANPHLAEQPPVLPAGIVIALPEEAPAVLETERLWG